MKFYQYKDNAWLTRKYCIDGQSIRKIARECRVGETTIAYWLRRHRVYTRSKYEAARLRGDTMKNGATPELANATYRDRKWLEEKRTKEKLTVVQIAEMCHVAHATISRWLKIRKFEPGGIKTGPFVVGVHLTMSPYLRDKVDEFCRLRKKKRSTLIRELLIKEMLKDGFNPYK